MSKARIFSLEDADVTERWLRRKEGGAVAVRSEVHEETVITRRKREETASRRHAFLSQTVPPSDPLVREIERRRSGGEDDEPE